MNSSSPSASQHRFLSSSAMRGRLGFTLMEMAIVIAMIGVLIAMGLPAMRNFMQQQRADRGTDAILWQITVARSYAIRTGQPVDLVVDKASRKLLVQDATKTWSVLDMGAGAALTVDSLDLPISGSKLAFSFRGFCLNCTTEGVILSVYAGGRKRQIQIGFLGKADRVKS